MHRFVLALVLALVPSRGLAQSCPEGLAAVDHAGHCCSPGQHATARGECEGAPTSCPPGQAPAAHGCVARACEPGRVRAHDGAHCCWPGQTYRATERDCHAEAAVTCPAETTRASDRRDCAPRVALERPRGATPAGMVPVGGGTFVMGARDRGVDGRYVTVGAYWIDRTEVTARAYARCVAAGRCDATSDPFGLDRDGSRPVVNVTHAMASAYCAFAGGRLPTEAEWELAARGTDARAYPWGERTPDCATAWFAGCRAEAPSAVGTLRAGASPSGALDMAGNVAEWTLDRAGTVRASGSDRDPVGAPEGTARVVRGGAFDAPASALRTTSRASHAADEARYDVGFRCVRPAPEPRPSRGAPAAHRPHRP